MNSLQRTQMMLKAMTYLTYPLVELLDSELGQGLVRDVVSRLPGDPAADQPTLAALDPGLKLSHRPIP